MVTIEAHGIPCDTGNDAITPLSAAQQRLLHEPRPIRVCGAPTGAGKTYAFLQAAKQGALVVFIVPTQALAHDIEESARVQSIPACRWDGGQSAGLRAAGKSPWIERKKELDRLGMSGGMLVTTPETLGSVLLGKPQFERAPLQLTDFLQAQHIVFDEAHTLTERAFGFLHFWAVLVTWWHRLDPGNAPKLSLLSATHSNLFEALCCQDENDAAFLSGKSVAFFDEAIENGRREGLRLLHGEVAVAIEPGELLTCVERYGSVALADGGRLLILYDSLSGLARDELQLRELLLGFGVRPEHCFLINGQDRKAAGESLGGSGFEAGLAPADKHRVIIATSSIEAGVNIKNLRHAILDPGQDAAALLQRIGRVARGDVDGKIWLTTPASHRPAHWLRLEQLSGSITISGLRDRLAPLRLLPLDRARRLGSGYWSMLQQKQPSVYAGLLRGHESISDARAPGAFLNSLRASVAATTRRYRKSYEKWLEALDRELADLRGFSPGVSIRFADYPVIEYSREWATAYLETPDFFDDGVWCYRRARSACLLSRPRRFTISLLCPDGSNFTHEYPTGNATAQACVDYVACIRSLIKRGHPDRDFLSKSAAFIAATGLLVREKIEDDPIL